VWRKKEQGSSSCYCEVEDGCGEDCHNRIMAYECDSTNCKLPVEQCGNRPFSQLKKRAKGNGYDYGVEVLHTEGRGYGVRAMRTFEPHQVIVEYAGEIITQAECERRMKQVYKNNKVSNLARSGFIIIN
jgi:palmitoyltransferase ZDHHC9/14/18